MNVKSEILIDKKIGKIVCDFHEKIVETSKQIIQMDETSQTLLCIKQDIKLVQDEEYQLEITSDCIEIKARTEQGAFYGLMTLQQLYKEETLSQLYIEDYPDLKIRGVMLDISRSKVPTVATLKALIDFFASLKYNHLELYVEGFSFEYRSFPNVLNDHNYLCLEEYLEIERYAKDKYIDFVPNQNGFGHMSDWLQKEEYHLLAECPEGFYIWGCHRIPSTLDPTNPESVKLVEKMYGDMLPYTSSSYFHMNFDEPYELGNGKSKEKCEQTSKEDVYIAYFNQLASVVRKYHKTPMLWGDVLINHSDKMKLLPQDAIFVDWGYNKDYPFAEHAKMLEKNKINYLLAPGTSSWSTITGRFIDMKETIENSTASAKQYHGLGVLVTDWGDMGHLQYLPSSYLGWIYGALLCWSNASLEDARKILKEKLKDTILEEVVVDLSTYHLLEGPYREYGSRLFSTIMWAEHAQRQSQPKAFFLEKMQSNYIEEENKNALKRFFSENKEKLKKAKQTLEKAEMENAIELLETLLEINDTLYSYSQACIVSFDTQIKKLETVLEKHRELWCARNKKEGYEFSANRIHWLIAMLMCLDRKERV